MKLLLGTALLLTLTVAQPANAGTITFNDLNNTVSYTTSGLSVTSLSYCSGEICYVEIIAPVGVDVYQSSATLTEYILEPTGLIISDDFGAIFDIPVVGPSKYDLTFGSASDETTGLGICNAGCLSIGTMREDGTVQVAGTIDWRDVDGALLRTDTIQFQSDVDPVPEPASIALFASALLGVGFLTRRKRKAS
jgi:hypothetical protein